MLNGLANGLSGGWGAMGALKNNTIRLDWARLVFNDNYYSPPRCLTPDCYQGEHGGQSFVSLVD
jgi:hypothetical protein